MKTLRGILLFELLPVLAVMAGAAIAYHHYGRRVALAEAEDRLASSARLTGELIDREIAPLAETLHSLTMQQAVGAWLLADRTRLTVAEQARREMDRSLGRVMADNPRIESVELYSQSGQPLAFGSRAPRDSAGGGSVQAAPWFAATLERGAYIGFESGHRIRLARTTSRSDPSGPPVVAALLYDFENTVREAAYVATRHLEQTQVLVAGPDGVLQPLHGNLPPAAPDLEASAPAAEIGATVTVRQTEAAALAAFRQAQRALLIPLGAVTLGLLLVAALGTQKIIGDLREAQQRTEEANAAKGEFLAHMSHEIRTPMNGILGMLQLLQTAKLKPQEREYLEMARESADSLLRLLNDILDFSKIEAGRLELEEAAFDLRSTIEGSLQTLALRAAEKGLRLNVHIDDQVPEILVGDAGRLRQILVNLVGNAIKFTAEGEIEVAVCPHLNGRQWPAGLPAASATAEPPTSTGHAACEFCLQISVRDTGIGIPADKQQLIFDAFRQADRSISRKFGGTGLGLAIAAELVGIMRGRLWLESEPERGSTFCFLLPLAVADELPAAEKSSLKTRTSEAPLPPATRRAHILLAEDGLINQRVASRLLERRGHRVEVVENGRQALQALERQHFDLLLMDVEMPEMDGIEATRAIRSAGNRIPIIALTAHAIKGDRERFLAAGMDDYIAKPVNSRSLYEAVERHLPSVAPPDFAVELASIPLSETWHQS